MGKREIHKLASPGRLGIKVKRAEGALISAVYIQMNYGVVAKHFKASATSKKNVP